MLTVFNLVGFGSGNGTTASIAPN